MADSTFTGNAQLGIGRATQDGGPVVGNPTVYAGKAKGLWPLSSDIHLQVDLFAEQDDDIVDVWGPQRSADASLLGGTVHLLHPFEKRARFGLAGSIWNTDVFVPAGNGKSDATYGLAAVEGQFFGADWTLTGQAGAFTSIECSGFCPSALEDGVFVRGKARYFLHDNTTLSVDAVRMWGNREDDIFGSKSLDYTKWLAEAEHRFQDSQFSIFLNVSHESIDSIDATGGMIGVKFYWNEQSLRTNDRDGAELDTPTFGFAPPLAGPAVEAIEVGPPD